MRLLSSRYFKYLQGFFWRGIFIPVAIFLGRAVLPSRSRLINLPEHVRNLNVKEIHIYPIKIKLRDIHTSCYFYMRMTTALFISCPFFLIKRKFLLFKLFIVFCCFEGMNCHIHFAMSFYLALVSLFTRT